VVRTTEQVDGPPQPEEFGMVDQVKNRGGVLSAYESSELLARPDRHLAVYDQEGSPDSFITGILTTILSAQAANPRACFTICWWSLVVTSTQTGRR